MKSENDKIDKIIARAKKMLSLAESTTFEHESETALRMVENLLAKYNLAMTDIGTDEPLNDTIHDDSLSNHHSGPWCKTVYRSVAELCSCRYLVATSNRERKITHIFVGKPHNIITAKSTAAYVLKAILRLNRDAKALLDPNSFDSSFNGAFRNGASHSIRYKIQDILNERKQEAEKTEATSEHNSETDGDTPNEPTGQALAIVMVDAMTEANEYTDNKYKFRRSKMHKRSFSVTSQSAYSAGRAAGSGISLHKQLS